MSFFLFATEFKRSFKNSLITIILCLTLGFILITSVNFKNYLEFIFTPEPWGAGLIILPKGSTPESARKNILAGKPDGLIPQALYETLLTQIADEQKKQGSGKFSIQLMAFVPFNAKADQPAIGALDLNAAKIFFESNKSFLSHLPLEDWNTKKLDYVYDENYHTAEWGQKTLFAILANGSEEHLKQLSVLINRRTVAEAFYVDDAHSDSFMKLTKLKSSLTFLTGLILLLTGLGLLLSFEILNANRKNISLILKELKITDSTKIKFYLLQILFLTIVPTSVGLLIGISLWSSIKLVI